MSRPFKDRTRFIGKDGLWYYDCIKCEMFFPEHKMAANSNYKFAVDKYCRVCRQEQREAAIIKDVTPKSYDRDGNLKDRWVISTARTFGTRFMNYSDYEDAMGYLKIVGYDTDKDIHEQFCDRIKEKYGVEFEKTKGKHTDSDPYPFKSPYKKDNQ